MIETPGSSYELICGNYFGVVLDLMPASWLKLADSPAVILTGQGGQSGCYFGEAGADVGCRGFSSPAVVLVAVFRDGNGRAGHKTISYCR